MSMTLKTPALAQWLIPTVEPSQRDTDGDGYNDLTHSPPTVASTLILTEMDMGTIKAVMLRTNSHWTTLNGPTKMVMDTVTTHGVMHPMHSNTDPTQWSDQDGDGYGDNASGNYADEYPTEPTQWSDSDNDGYGDNSSRLQW